MTHLFEYQVTHVTPFAHDIAQIILQPINTALTYQAGQYVNVICEDRHSPLSIACAPNANHSLEFHLFHPVKNHKAKELLHRAQQHQSWQLSNPLGHCTANRLMQDKTIVFLAHGTGFAPIKAVIEALTQLPHPPTMSLYWLAAQSAQFYLTDLLNRWTKQFDFNYVTIIAPERHFSVNSACLQTILQQHPNLTKRQVYASGPRTLISSAYDCFATHGLKPADFFSDLL